MTGQIGHEGIIEAITNGELAYMPGIDLSGQRSFIAGVMDAQGRPGHGPGAAPQRGPAAILPAIAMGPEPGTVSRTGAWEALRVVTRAGAQPPAVTCHSGSRRDPELGR